jgi:hypothetical protein
MKSNLNEAETYGFQTGGIDTNKAFPGGDGGDWGGSMPRALKIGTFARDCTGDKNPFSSQKRSRVKTASGNVSDHYKGNLSAYAIDIPASGKKGDELLACIMKKFNNGSHSSYKGGSWLNVNVGGYRYQFGWRVKDHYDHIHVGVKKIGGSSSSNLKGEEGLDLSGGSTDGTDSFLSTDLPTKKPIGFIDLFKSVADILSPDKKLKEDVNRMKDIMKKIL